MQAPDLLRTRSEHGHHRVTFVELFYDLVFVFAITQLSHRLLHHLDALGAVQTALLLVAVWWSWVNTAWVTNWLDPEKAHVRLMLFALMLLGLFLSSSIPQAFEDRGLWFAIAYVLMQMGRDAFMLWALAGRSDTNFRNFQRITSWHALGCLLWLLGGMLQGHWRILAWGLAVAIDTVAPSLGYHVPGLGRSTTTDWDVEGEHMAERFGLFIIIALGESVLVTGATMADLAWNGVTAAAFVIGFVGSVAMWWIYFNIGSERASHMFAESRDPGRIARLAYTYIHLLLVAGIIVSAVGDEVLLKHPLGHTETSAVLVLVGGPLLFVLGNLLFKWVTAGWPPLSHLVGLGLLVLLGLTGGMLQPIALAGGASSILVLVAVWEMMSLGAPPQHE